MPKIPPPIEFLEAYFLVSTAMKCLEAIPEPVFLGPAFDESVTNAFNELDTALGDVSWIVETINELRENA